MEATASGDNDLPPKRRFRDPKTREMLTTLALAPSKAA